MGLIRKYGVFGSVRLLLSWLRTKIFYPQARLIRFPFEIRNRRFIQLGARLTTGVGCRLEALPQDDHEIHCIHLGTGVQLNDYVHIGAIKSVYIGNDVLIASKVFITDHNHGNFESSPRTEMKKAPIERALEAKPVHIGDRCWLGENVVILPGVSLGEGCVVGASAVVTKAFPAYSLIIGNPGRLYKRYNIESEQWELIR